MILTQKFFDTTISLCTKVNKCKTNGVLYVGIGTDQTDCIIRVTV